MAGAATRAQGARAPALPSAGDQRHRLRSSRCWSASASTTRSSTPAAADWRARSATSRARSTECRWHVGEQRLLPAVRERRRAHAADHRRVQLPLADRPRHRSSCAAPGAGRADGPARAQRPAAGRPRTTSPIRPSRGAGALGTRASVQCPALAVLLRQPQMNSNDKEQSTCLTPPLISSSSA